MQIHYLKESVSAIKSDIISNRDEIIKRKSTNQHTVKPLYKHMLIFYFGDIEIMTKIVGIANLYRFNTK